MRKGRLEAFSDGVFAIAITLLVVEIAIPRVNGETLLGALIAQRQMYLAYFVAFMTIGTVWMEHSALVDGLHHIDAVFMRLNLVLLLFVGFLPFPTGLVAEYSGDRAGERVAVTLFGVVLFLQILTLIAMARYAEREGLFADDVVDERSEESRIRYQLGPSLVAYAVAVGVSLLTPYLGVTAYLAIALYLAVPIRTLRRLLRRRD